MLSEDRYACLRLENQLCFPLYACAKEVVRRYKPILDELDITYTQYITMMALWEHRSLSLKDIGAMICLDSGTLTPLLKKLEEKGYVERSRDRDDERVLTVSVTEKGMDLRERALSVPGSVATCIPISPEEALILARILRRMMAEFSAQQQ
ncbi:MAG: MarR family transcriptional regulator [Candidatus Methanomethylophilaceae archaeon]|nr:MarR family transcriptional regulator [Candidatus Methanomethylophilaceae archaeon]